jgi:S-(hydroxymethyl)glutathione dehydrogenase/alcohol dehydrogenase
MKAAVLLELNRPLEIIDLIPPALSAGQVLVRVITSGLCGAQLQEIRGEKGNSKFLPHLMGHEGFGQIIETGPGVAKVSSGDFVSMHWRAGQGLTGAPAAYGVSSGEHVGGGPITTLATHAVVSESRVTRLPPETPSELGALTTAFGVVQNQVDLPFGGKVAVLGAGGLGLSIISALALRGAGEIIAIDIHENKRALALKVGATAYAAELDVEVDVIIDTTGIGTVVNAAMTNLQESGQMILLVNNAKTYELSSKALFAGDGLRIVPTQGGRSNPDIDIPRLSKFLQQRPEAWEPLVTHRYSLEEINQAVETLGSGIAGRVMIQTSEE